MMIHLYVVYFIRLYLLHEENDQNMHSMWFELSPHVKRVKVYALSKVVGFLRALRFPPTGKVDRVG